MIRCSENLIRLYSEYKEQASVNQESEAQSMQVKITELETTMQEDLELFNKGWWLLPLRCEDEDINILSGFGLLLG